MSPNESKSLDLLGMKPVADAVSAVTTAGVAGAGAFLSRICLPAAEEFGLLLQDKVKGWRGKNVSAVIAKAEELVNSRENSDALHAHPRLVGVILDQGSWTDVSE